MSEAGILFIHSDCYLVQFFSLEFTFDHLKATVLEPGKIYMGHISVQI